MAVTFQELIDSSGRIVFFGGAGVSTESGIPDFRGVDGLYRQKYRYPPETIISHSFFMKNPEEFFAFYREKMVWLGARPNDAHLALAVLEQKGKLKAVVTQNIDGLHQMAGSKTVYELHGSIHRNHCMRCGAAFSVDAVMCKGIPRCACGGIIKPDVVLYEEMLNERVMRSAATAIASADLLIVGGTSLGVYPAAGLIDYFKGKAIVLINRTPTPYDDRADLVLREDIGAVFSHLKL